MKFEEYLYKKMPFLPDENTEIMRQCKDLFVEMIKIYDEWKKEEKGK